MTLSNFTSLLGASFLLAIILILTPAKLTSANLEGNVKSQKQEILILAHNIAKQDNHAFPLLLPAIILQETSAGTISSYKVAGHEFGLPPNKRYYGLAQVKLATAREVLKAYPQVRNEFGFQTNTDEEIIAKLIENDIFNLSIASKYILILKRYGFSTIEQLALAYNQGPSGALKFDPNSHYYPRAILGHIKRLNFR